MKALLRQELDYVDYIHDATEEITADTVSELIELAVSYTSEVTIGKPCLYLISEDLSARLQEKYAKKLAREREEALEKEAKRLSDAAKTKIRSLEERIEKIASGEEEQRLRAELAAVKAT